MRTRAIDKRRVNISYYTTTREKGGLWLREDRRRSSGCHGSLDHFHCKPVGNLFDCGVLSAWPFDGEAFEEGEAVPETGEIRFTSCAIILFCSQ